MNPFLIRRLRGPVLLLCFAVTALLAQWHILSFARSWPIYLIGMALLRMVEVALPFTGFAAAGYGRGYAGVPMRRGSLTFAVAELILGVVALLVNTSVLPLSDFWHVYSTWWPLLLILLGLLLLVERLFDSRLVQGAAQGYGNAGVYLPRRRRSGGLVFLVIVLILLGMVGRHHSSMSDDDWHWDPDWNWSLDGETHENDVNLQQPLAADAALTVDNAHGDLQIAPSTDGMIHVDAHQVAHVSDNGKQRAFDATRPVLTIHGANATVSVPGSDGVDVRLVLAVPEGVLCTVHNHHGDISISGLKRALEITQDHGDVALDSLGSGVRLTMDHGDVHARAIAGDLLIDGRADDVVASDVQGKTMLRGEFFGSTQLDGIKGEVGFHSNRTEISAQRLSGQLSLDSDDLKVDGASGGLTVTTRSKSVEITDLSGDATVTDSNGDMSVASRKPIGAMTLRNSTGDVTLSLPEGTGFSLNASTNSDDDLSSEFALAQTASGGSKRLSGQVGTGGPHIDVSTNHGDVTIRKGSGSIEAPEAPIPPGPPEKPARPDHVRHLKEAGEPPSESVQ